jgi:hypothetical protein
MTKSKKSEKLVSKLGRIVNSTFAFCIMYIALVGFYYFLTALMGKVFGFEATAYYYGVKFHKIYNQWTRLNVTFIYGVGTLFLFIAGIVSTYVFYKYKEKQFPFLIMFPWGTVIAGSMFAAQGLIVVLGEGQYSSSFYQNLTVVFAWLQVPTVFTYILITPFFILGFLFTFFYGKPFVTLAYSYSKVIDVNRKSKFFFETVLIPYVLGSAICLIFTFPLNVWINLVYIGYIGVSVLFSFYIIRFQSVKQDEVLHYKTLQTVSIVLIVIFLILMLIGFLTWRGLKIPF